MSLKDISAKIGAIETKPITLEDSLSMIMPLKIEPPKRANRTWRWYNNPKKIGVIV